MADEKPRKVGELRAQVGGEAVGCLPREIGGQLIERSGQRHSLARPTVLGGPSPAIRAILGPLGLQRLQAAAQFSGSDRSDAAGEFALLDPAAVADVLPADRLSGSFADSSFNDLIEDIKTNGQHDAITVRPTKHGFEIASGRRRLEACRRLGIQVLARIRSLDQDAMLGIQFAENERRQDISAIERARWLAQVREIYGKQVQQLADDYKLDRTTVSLYLRLARLPEEIVQRLVDARVLPMLKARRLMAALEQDAGALARVVAALDSQLSASEARGSKPSPDDQVEAAIRAAEGRSLPRGLDDAAAGIPNDKRVIVHRGRRIGTLIRNGGQWVVRFASTTDERLVLAIAERLSDLRPSQTWGWYGSGR